VKGMRIKELLQILQNFDPEAFIYINYEPNFEDEFCVVKADDDNILIVPNYLYEHLAKSQDLSFIVN
jgi:hypothetical protein